MLPPVELVRGARQDARLAVVGLVEHRRVIGAATGGQQHERGSAEVEPHARRLPSSLASAHETFSSATGERERTAIVLS
jgi:hypothetical protein